MTGTLASHDCSCSAINKLVEGQVENKVQLHSVAMDARNSLGFTLDLYHKYGVQARVRGRVL